MLTPFGEIKARAPGVVAARAAAPADVDWLQNCLRNVGFFSRLDRAQLAEILTDMLLLRYAPGTAVCAEGETGDALYLVRSGAVVVTKKKREKPVARLRPGDFFGEMALLLGEPRSATVTTEEESEIFCLSSEDFNAVVGRVPAIAASLRWLAAARRQELRDEA